MEVTTLRPLKAMSEEQLKAFLDAVKADAGLQQKIKAAADADAVVAIAKAAGFVISTEELLQTQNMLSDEELESVAGGCGPGGISLFSQLNPYTQGCGECGLTKVICKDW